MSRLGVFPRNYQLQIWLYCGPNERIVNHLEFTLNTAGLGWMSYYFLNEQVLFPLLLMYKHSCWLRSKPSAFPYIYYAHPLDVESAGKSRRFIC